MALDIDAFHVLRAIAAEPSLFAGIRAEVAKEAGKFTDKLRTLLAKQVKANAGDIDAVRSIRGALGTETFDLVIEGMKDGDLKTLVGKLDKHHPEQKVADAAWRLGHLRALIAGAIEPARAPAKKQKMVSPKSRAGKRKGVASRRSQPAEDEFLSDPSAGAVRKR
jgi:hypothetical protein